MMKNHKVSKSRTLVAALGAGGMLVAGLGLSAPGFAQEAPRADKKTIVKKLDKDGKVTVLEGADVGQLVRNCPDAEKVASEVTSGDEGQKHRTRVVICNKDGKAPTPEMRERLVAALEKAMSESGGITEMSPERRQQAMEALQREIDRVRSEGKN